MNDEKLNVFEPGKLGGYRCWYCGTLLPIGSPDMTADHFWPKRLGGRLKVVCCKQCNKRKGGMVPLQWAKTLKEMRALATDETLVQKYDRMIVATETLWKRVRWSVKKYLMK